MEEETAEVIASTLSLGGLYPSAGFSNLLVVNGPVDAVYTGDGNVVRLGHSRLLSSTDQSFYNGIWGYATGE